MNTKKITESEIAPLTIASLPTRPTAPTAFGGKGLTSTEMKEAFDRLPMLAITRLNELIDDITTGQITNAIPVFVSDNISTLEELIEGIEDGNLAGAIMVLGAPLSTCIGKILSDIDKIKKTLGIED
jgi:hypothetical protein